MIRPLSRALLAIASVLVPTGLRAEWRSEWSAELWVLLDARSNAAPFCLGAFRDALWFRLNTPRRSAPAVWLQSPFHCLLFLVVLAAAGLLFAVASPGVRDTLLPEPYGDNLVILSRGRTPAMVDYRAVENHTHRMFSAIAHYRPVRMRVNAAELQVALASGNLFEVLGLPVRFHHHRGLILTDAAWRLYFNADPRVTERMVEAAGRPVPIAAIVPENSWRLPGRVDAWLLGGDSERTANPEAFLVGRMRRPVATWGSFSIADGRRFTLSPVIQRAPMVAHLMVVVTALILLPLTTAVALGEYPAATHANGRATNLRRWAFLVLKFALIVPAVFFGTLALAQVIGPGGLQPQAALAGYVLAFRWALNDQRRRCPVCLGRLTNPVRIGHPAHIFLEWYGTEFICASGHGLLHVPETPTESYRTQQWLYLDPSWRSLFS